MIKTYSEMQKIDVMPYCKTREAKDERGKTIKVPYLPWGRCKQLLHDNGAEVVYYEPLTNAEGSSLFMSAQTFTDKNGGVNRCYEVRVRIVIDDLDFTYSMPLLNGTYVVRDDTMNQLRLNNAQARAFVKGVAIRTGLGFSLWLDEDMPDSQPDDLSSHKAIAIKQRIEQLITTKLQQGKSIDDIAKAAGVTAKQLRQYLNALPVISNIEARIQKL